MGATYPAAIGSTHGALGAAAVSAALPRRSGRGGGRREAARPTRRCRPRRASRSPAARGSTTSIVVMMENRSFDHILGWLPGADGKAVRALVHRCGRRVAPDVPARARLPGLRLQRSRPFIRRRARRVEQRRVRRLVARGEERPVLDRVLPAAGSRRSSARSRRRSPPATGSSRRSSARRSRTGSTRFRASPTASSNTVRRGSTCRRSSTASRRRRCPRPTTTATSTSCCCTSATTRSRIRTRSSSSSAGPASCRRSRTSTRATRSTTRGPGVGQPGERRPSARRHSSGRVLHVDDLQRRHDEPGVVTHAAHLSRSTNGAASSITCRHPRRPPM